MTPHRAVLTVATDGAGFVEVTAAVRAVVEESGVREGQVLVYCPHTSCSLAIQENADPSARRDMEEWLARLAPEGDPAYAHTAEGPDDSPSHLRALVTRTSEMIPIIDGRAAFGTWQGLFLCEHRRGRRERRLIVQVTGA